MPHGSERGRKHLTAGHTVLPWAFTPQPRPGHSPTLDSQTVASPAHPAQPLGLCKCSSLCLGCPPLVCLPSKGFCVLCHLKDCLPCEVSTGSPRQTQAPLSLSFIHIYPAFIISLQVSLPTGPWALRPVVWGDSGLPPRVTDLGVLLHCTPTTQGHQRQEQSSLSWVTSLNMGLGWLPHPWVISKGGQHQIYGLGVLGQPTTPGN